MRFDNKTSYALLDIDALSQYLDQLPTIRAALETIGIVRTVLLRSSWSGGLHLYIPLPAPVSTFDLACALRQCLESQGFEVKDGQLEIFPNTKAFGEFWKGKFTEYKAHRLPLQPGSGSCLLNDNLQPIGGDLERFFYAWDMAALSQDMDELHQALTIAKSNRRRQRRRAVGPVEEWKNELELEIAGGWTGHGQTNALLKSIACYGRVFERLEGEALREYTERIATSRPGFERWCHHHHDIRMRCKVWASAVERYYWPLGTEPKRDRSLGKFMSAINRRRQEDACDRITAAYQQLKAEGGLPEQIRELAKRLTRQANCSMATLYKYLGLWHPEHLVCNAPPTPTTSDTEGACDRPIPSPTPTAETFTNRGVTHRGGKYEGCSAETDHLKNLSPGGRRGGRGGEEGFSTGDFAREGWPL
ncbi:MAG: hypothetical protein ICV62_16005 [Cyanobacteria bacterium Co-bin13]|nr:hypothetical protein [Cyanobacteria bacterium Co-bin13]